MLLSACSVVSGSFKTSTRYQNVQSAFNRFFQWSEREQDSSFVAIASWSFFFLLALIRIFFYVHSFFLLLLFRPVGHLNRPIAFFTVERRAKTSFFSANIANSHKSYCEAIVHNTNEAQLNCERENRQWASLIKLETRERSFKNFKILFPSRWIALKLFRSKKFQRSVHCLMPQNAITIRWRLCFCTIF